VYFFVIVISVFELKIIVTYIYSRDEILQERDIEKSRV
jgi:hypothetical protein